MTSHSSGKSDKGDFGEVVIGGIKKSHWFFLSILAAWFLCIFHFDPMVWGILEETDPIATRVSLACFIGFLDLFWLYGIYHSGFAAHKLIRRERIAPPAFCESPPIALLYTTCNDFSERAALSCVRQDYSSFHIFLLDDSTDPSFQNKVDRFHECHALLTTVVRRNSRIGFKAGNLNHALNGPASKFDYFAVIDSDEVIPSDFLSRMLPYFGLDATIAFVQAHHEMNPSQASSFARDLGPGINFHWDVYQEPRNQSGCVVFYGHGAIIRRAAWKLSGGFPEIVSEDLAFSTQVRQLGFRGHFVRDVTCYEDFPETYQQFRKRHEKWVKGACEYLHHHFRSFLVSRRVTLPEKIDVMLSCFSLFLPALFLLFLLVANAVLPMQLAEKHTLSVSIMNTTLDIMPGYFLEPRFRSLARIDFYLITFVGMFGALFCYFGSLFSHPWKLGRLLIKSCVPYISLILVTTFAVISYLLTRKAVFLSTGDRSDQAACRDQDRVWTSVFTANHSLVFHLEWILGFILAYFSVATRNLILLTIASALTFSPMIRLYGWESRSVGLIVSTPLLFTVLAIAESGFGVIGLQGFSLQFVTVHF